jgi:hypothetical protein
MAHRHDNDAAQDAISHNDSWILIIKNANCFDLFIVIKNLTAQHLKVIFVIRLLFFGKN